MKICDYCVQELPDRAAHDCKEGYVMRLAAMNAHIESAVRWKKELEKEYQNAVAPLQRLFEAIALINLFNTGAAARAMIERIQRSIALADASLWLAQIGDDEHKPLYDEALIQWAKFKYKNDTPQFPLMRERLSNELLMCKKTLEDAGEISSAYQMKATISQLRERLEKLTLAAAHLMDVKLSDGTEYLVPVSMAKADDADEHF